MFEQKIRKIHEVKMGYGEKMREPAGLGQLDALCDAATAFAPALPPAYLALLGQTNGIHENGFVVYPAETWREETSGDVVFPGFIEQNKGWRLDNHNENVVVFGDGDMDYYILDTSLGTYHTIDKVSHEKIEDFSSAEALFDYILDNMIG